MNKKTSTASRPSTVLIVEDNPFLIDLYKTALSDIKGVRFVVAANGFQGLVQTCEHSPEVIITDLDMPGFDGFKMLNILQVDPDHRDVPLVVISGLEEGDIAQNGGLPPGVPFIRKQDFSAPELRALVKQGIEKRVWEPALS